MASFETKYDALINDNLTHCKERALEKWGITTPNIPLQALKILSAPCPRKFDSADLNIKITKTKKLLCSNHQATLFLLADFEVFVYRLTFSLTLPIKSELSAVFSYKDVVSLITGEGVARYNSYNNPANAFYCPEKICRLSTIDGYHIDFFIDNNQQSQETVLEIRKELFTKKAYQED